MDPNYDIAKASKSLCRYMTERMDDRRSSLQLLNMFEGEDSEPFSIMEIGPLGRLVIKEDQASNESPTVEVVVAVQGIVTAKELPPFKGRFNQSKIGYLRQAVTIAIIDSDAIDAVLDRIGRVQSIFKRHYGNRLQDSCAFANSITGHHNYSTFDISNRLFKKKNDGDHVRDLGRSIDPDGNLGTAAERSGFVHTTDNEVHFYERKRDIVRGDYRFVSAEPTIYQVGDIVEIQMSFVALPLHQRKTKMSLILRSIGLMDAQYSKACEIDKFKNAAKSSTVKRTNLKRYIGYTEENMSIAQHRMNEMVVDDGRRGHTIKHSTQQSQVEDLGNKDGEGRGDKRRKEDGRQNGYD